MTQEDAETIALEALAYVAAEPRLFDRYLALTGQSVDDLRARAGEVETMAGVLGFLVGHEPDLLRFAHDRDIPAQRVAEAWHRLDPHGMAD